MRAFSSSSDRQKATFTPGACQNTLSECACTFRQAVSGHLVRRECAFRKARMRIPSYVHGRFVRGKCSNGQLRQSCVGAASSLTAVSKLVCRVDADARRDEGLVAQTAEEYLRPRKVPRNGS
eukprot:6186234-Pleurochrysis_carterae.AAC.3